MKNNPATPRPWNGSKHTIFGSMKESEEQKANFDLAIHAVNNFDALLEALKRVVERELDLDPESRNYWDDELNGWQQLIKKCGRI